MANEHYGRLLYFHWLFYGLLPAIALSFQAMCLRRGQQSGRLFWWACQRWETPSLAAIRFSKFGSGMFHWRPPLSAPVLEIASTGKKMENSFYQPLATRSSNGLTSWEGGKLAFSWKPPKQTQTSQLSNLSDLNNQTKTYKRWCNNFYVLHLPLRNDVVYHPKAGWFHV